MVDPVATLRGATSARWTQGVVTGSTLPEMVIFGLIQPIMFVVPFS